MKTAGTYLTGQLLLAMPAMSDPRFDRTVIYLCAHSPEGALGLVVNRLVDHINFPDLLDQLNIETDTPARQIRVHFGGPVETGRGFVLHSADYTQDSTLQVNDQIGLTASVGILEAIAQGDETPRHSLLALGYAGWGPGQLDHEVHANVWLQAPADDAILFDANIDSKWDRAVASLGIDISFLSSDAGHA
ncbi:MAG: YqgE/AlgH family protein [Proteobacteria bacterium]|nr:YqgE/AlgH family protein [Pseudomonadota bacterium]MDA1059650.1 YqgE/AlgH family protein [Pseudomonadota bacterium]